MPTLRMRAATPLTESESGQGLPIPIVAATRGIKQDGEDLAKLPWDFSRGEKEGGRYRFPLLWVHDLQGRNLPVGVADVGIGPDGTSLSESAAIFDPDDELAVRIERKYRSPIGGLKGFSITWDEVDAAGGLARVTRKPAVANQLMEVSCVPVGIDIQAVKKKAGSRGLAAGLEDILNDLLDDQENEAVDESAETNAATESRSVVSPDEVDPWTDVAAAMVDVFGRSTDDSDDKRGRAYRALLPAYRRAGKTPPEWLDGSELRALDDGNWRALFLSGELELMTRVGKELNARNLSELDDIATALAAATKRIRSLVDRVKAGSASGEGDTTGDAAETDKAAGRTNDDFLSALNARLLAGGSTN